jgi:TP901 family phage tail tape measure protein
MANSYQEFTTEIKLNSENAKNKLEELKKDTDDLIRKRNQLIQGHGDSTDINNLNKQIQRNNKSMTKFAKTSQSVTEILHNLGKVSLDQLMYAERTLNAEMKKTPQNTQYFEDLAEKLKSVKTQIAGIRTQTKQNYQEQKQLNDEMANMKHVLENVSTSSLKELAMAEGTLKRQMQEVVPGSTGYNESADKLKIVQNRIREINLAQQETNATIQKYNEELALTQKDTMTIEQENKLINATLKNLDRSSIRDIEYSLKIINEQLRGMDRGTEKFRQMTNQAKSLKTQLERVRQEGMAQRSWIGRMADGFNRMQGIVMSVVATIMGLFVTVRKCVSNFAKMEDVMANVRKYTGQTDAQVRQMNEDFKKMDTRTSREQLNDLAGAAGRLGITSKKMVEEFVDGADKINVALGDDLGQGAVDKIGKLAIMFGEDKTKGLRGAMYATGSAINELAQNSSANAGYIINFTADLSGVGKQAKMTQTELMGIGSALDQNMQEEATSSTVFSQLITKMFQDPAKFAKLAGENVKKFTKQLKTDANGALLQFLESMKKKGGFANMAPMFESMNLNGSRAVGVLSAVASHLDEVKKAQALANREYNKGTSVINEFNIQNNTQAAKLDKAKKEFLDLSIALGQKLLPITRYTISTGSLLVHLLSTIISFVSEYKTTILTLVAAIAVLTEAEKAHNQLRKLNVFWNRTLKNSFKDLWKVISKNPYLAIGAAIVTVIALIADLTKKTNANEAAQKNLDKIRQKAKEDEVDETNKIYLLVAAAKNEKMSLDDRQKAINQLNAIIPNYNAQLDKTTHRYIQNKQALDSYLQSLTRKYELEGAKDMLKNLGKQLADAKVKAAQAAQAFKDAKKAGKGYTYTTSFGMVGNTSQDLTSKTKGQMKSAQQDVKDLQNQVKVVLDEYGSDLQKQAIKTGNTVTNTIEKDIPQGMSDKEKKALEKKEKARQTAARRAQIAAEKRRRAADKKEQAEMNLHLAKLTSLYARGKITYQNYLDEKEKILTDGLNKRKAIWGKGSAQYDNIQKQMEEADQRYNEERREADLKSIEVEKQQRDAAIKAQYYDKNSSIYMNEDAANEALFQSDQNALKKQMALFGEGTRDWLELRNQLEDNDRQHQLENSEKYMQRLSDYRERWGKVDLEAQEKMELNGLESLLKKKLIKQKEYEEMKRQIQIYYGEQKSEQRVRNSDYEITQNNAHTAYQTASNNATAEEENNPMSHNVKNFFFGDITHYRNTIEQLDLMYKDDAQHFSECQEAKAEALNNFLKNVTTKAQTAYDSVSQIMDATSSYYSAQSEYEQNVTTKKYKRLETAAGNNTARTQKLEEKKEREIAKIKSKYSKKQMKMELAQATATMLLGSMRAYTSVWEGAPWPANQVLAPIAAGIAMAAGMINLAAIKKQHQAEEAGYYEGGFTSGINYHQPAGIVHQGEFVANHNALANTSIMPVLRLIDMAQRNNTVGSLTAADVSNQLGQGSSAVIAPVVQVNSDNKGMVSTMEGVSQVVDKLNRTIDRGIPAIVSIDGQNGVAHQLDRFHKLQDNK